MCETCRNCRSEHSEYAEESDEEDTGSDTSEEERWPAEPVWHGNPDNIYWHMKRDHNGIVSIEKIRTYREGEPEDYDCNPNYIRNHEGRVHVFENPDTCIKKLNQWFDKSEIDPYFFVARYNSRERSNIRE